MKECFYCGSLVESSVFSDNFSFCCKESEADFLESNSVELEFDPEFEI